MLHARPKLEGRLVILHFAFQNSLVCNYLCFLFLPCILANFNFHIISLPKSSILTLAWSGAIKLTRPYYG